jgi:hypothetical protein
MILVKEFRKHKKKYSTGFVDVLYWEMTICCEVVVLKDRSKVWFKIPQFIDPETGKKINMIMWISKTISDAFQDEVREQLAQKFPEALQIPSLQEIRKSTKKSKSRKKNINSTPYINNTEKDFERLLPFKARSESRFKR